LGADTRPVYDVGQTAGDIPANCAPAYPNDVLNSNNLGEWVCEHRNDALANMVQFRAVTAGQSITNWQNIGGAPSNHIAFGLGSVGFVAINRTGSNATMTYVTSMSDGVYCDVISGQRTADGSACTGNSVTVSGGQIVGYTLNAMSAFAIHTESLTGAPQLSASQGFNLPGNGSNSVAAALLTHDGEFVAGQTVNFAVISGLGGVSSPGVATDGSGAAAVTYTAPNNVTIAIVRTSYTASNGQTYEALTAVYVRYRATVTDLYVGRLGSSASLSGAISVIKTGSSSPLLTLARFDGNPQSSQQGGSEKSPFVDIHLPDATGVTSLAVEITCAIACNGGDTVWWGNPVTGVWTAVSNAGVTFLGDRVTFTLDGSSTPSLGQLTGTPFVVSGTMPTVITLKGLDAAATPLLWPTLFILVAGAVTLLLLRRRASV
jgi:hypothetical protein